jgi:hypothetical protein
MPLHMMVSVHIQEFVSSSRAGQIGGLRTTIRYASGRGMGKRLLSAKCFLLWREESIRPSFHLFVSTFTRSA